MGKTKISKAQILDALRSVVDPDLGRDIVSLGFVKDVRIEGGRVSITVELTTPACPVKDRLREECRAKVAALPGVEEVDVEMTAQTRRLHAPSGPFLEGVKNIVAVASGKGGVGKSTVAVNLALALARKGAKVGILDADVYGPSQAMMLGVTEKPRVSEERKLIPVEAYGVKLVSMGLLTDANRAVIWRGPMVHGLIQQFVRDVDWGDLDYLVVDLPPGTGDAQLSISQIVSISGAVIVTTPQDVSLLDARKGLAMFRELKVPVLGIVENMSYFECPHCGGRTEIFRTGGGRKVAEELGTPFLGAIPIDPEVVVGGDEGRPIVVARPDSPAARAFLELAGEVAAKLSILAEEGVPAGKPIMPEPLRKDKGGGPGGQDLRPVEIRKSGRGEIEILWSDKHVSRYPAAYLRRNCRCASCVDERTGERILRPDAVPEDIEAEAIEPVGRYAIHIAWSDGHRSGIYTFEHLRKLCPCDACAGAGAAK